MVKLHVTCHAPIGILYTGMAEETRYFEILKQPYHRNHLMDFYGMRPNRILKPPLSLPICMHCLELLELQSSGDRMISSR